MSSKELWNRILSRPMSKSLGCSLSISTFFVAYFFVLNNPLSEVKLLPILPIDEAIPISNTSAWVYFSLWVYICLPCSLMKERQPMGYYLYGSLLLALSGLVIFIVYPTAVPAWEIDWTQYPTLEFLKTKDDSGNACPSLHVAFAVFCFSWLALLLKKLIKSKTIHIVNALWATAIIISTMTTKQHLLIDVVAGIILGGVVFFINYSFLRRNQIEI